MHSTGQVPNFLFFFWDIGMFKLRTLGSTQAVYVEVKAYLWPALGQQLAHESPLESCLAGWIQKYKRNNGYWGTPIGQAFKIFSSAGRKNRSAYYGSKVTLAITNPESFNEK